MAEKKQEMERYARLALEQCNLENSNTWELATIAEANMYLKKWQIAEEYYRKAARGVDVRDKSSIYSNAYFGYMTLTARSDKDDAFLKMLEEVYLQ